MTPQEAAAAYLVTARGRELSPDTVTAYRQALRHFVPCLPEGDCSEIRPANIETAWSSLAAKPTLGANTLRHYRIVLATFLDWCVANAGLANHTLRKIPLPKKTAPKRPKISRDRLIALRAACCSLESEYDRSRALAMLETAWSSLLRRNELIMMHIGDVRLEDDPPQVKIARGKGGWSGFLPISDAAAAALRQWLKVRGDAPHDWLWCNTGEQRRHMSEELLMRLLRKLAVIAKIPLEDCKPHALRRGSATAMLQGGLDIGTVSKYLRHASIATTMMYVESDSARIVACRNWMAGPDTAPLPVRPDPPRPDPAVRSPVQPRRQSARKPDTAQSGRMAVLQARCLRVHYRGAA